MRKTSGAAAAAAAVALCLAASAAAQTPEAARRQRFADRDLNRDGVMTLSEYTSTGGHPGNFRALDRNNDRRLTVEEFIDRNWDDEVGSVLFADMDLDRDGRLTREEWRGAGAAFDDLDANRDGAVSRAEYESPLPADSPERRFLSLDRNRSGSIERNEWRGSRASFDRADRNNDARVSWKEFLMPRVADTPAARFDALDRNNDRVISRWEWREEKRAFDRLDRNNDGRVSRQEYLNPPPVDSREARFDELDRNNDGVLSRAEWRGERISFHRADANADGVVTFREFWQGSPVADDDVRYEELDQDQDGVLERREWTGQSVPFETADRNRDGAVTRWEFNNLPPGSGGGAEAEAELRFDDMDHNNDGLITRWEWHGEVSGFHALDRNDDNLVTLREFLAGPPADTRADRFRTLDTNGDGMVSASEWQGDPETFVILDRSRDRMLSQWEFAGGPGLADRFRRLDYDRDGNLSNDEWTGSAESFRFFDRNGDGRISRDEYVG